MDAEAISKQNDLNGRKKNDKLAGMIDHTLLKPDATLEEVRAFIEEARDYGFASVCLNPNYIEMAKLILEGTKTKVCTVIDFPLGAGGPVIKSLSGFEALELGADELDFVADIGLIKAHQWEVFKANIDALVKVWRSRNSKCVIKIILETCLLTDEEITESSKIAAECGVDFVKTSTGFSKSGATVHAVELMKKAVGNKCGVKASGGIHNYQEAMEMIKAGATRIGASSGIKILETMNQ